MTSRTRRKAGQSKTSVPCREEMIGRQIEVEWPSEEPNEPSIFYVALVLAFNPRRKLHKVVYMEDESIEQMELGRGPSYRNWRPCDTPADHLIGAHLRFHDKSVEEGKEAWYDFMRLNPERRRAPFEVYVYAHIEDPDPEEITGPKNAEGECNFYRVIHSPNDYLTTVDLSCIDYEVLESLKQGSAHEDGDATDNAPGETDTAPIDLDAGDDTGLGDTDAPASRSRVRANRTPTKPVNVIPDDENLPEDLEDSPIDAVRKRGKPSKDDMEYEAPEGTDRDKSTYIIEDDDEKDVKSSKSGRKHARGRDVDADGDEGDTRDARRLSDSPATLDTKDEPLGRAEERAVSVEDDEKVHDTASDEEMLGWAQKAEMNNGSDKMAATGSKVGEYISVDSGDGGPRRKAYVEAFLPAIGTHFVGFCDPQGGNLQIKLTEDNHTVLSDKEAELLTRKQSAAVDAMDVDDVKSDEPEVQMLDDFDEKPKARRPKRGRKYSSSKVEKKTSVAKNTRRRQMLNSGKILGKAAGEEIVTRCITVVWPNTKLVYVALVMGYSYEKRQHILLYMVDHCVETLDLRYREWSILPRGKEPWNSTGMVGKRVFVWWPGEYDEKDVQVLAESLFGDRDTKVAYEAYVINFIGKGKYKIVYPSNEDCEERELSAEKSEGTNPLFKEWDLLEDGVNDVMGLPVIGWQG